MSRSRLTALVFTVAIVLSLLPAAGAGAARKRAPAPLPAGFVGMNVNQPLFPESNPALNLGHQLSVMVSSGVESIRVPFDWAATQPYMSWSDVPASQRSQFTDVGGIPTRWGPLDQIVGLAAARGLTLLPTVLDAPAWDGVSGAGAQMDIPGSPYYFANFLTALVDRYGPKGTFWAKGAPKLPIEMWQIWNEPNLVSFWWQQPFQVGYVNLLAASYTAIKAADPKAKVVLAGFPNYSWGYLERIYRVDNARRFFDIVAIHPYTAQPQGVITIAEKVRQAMNTHGDPHKPMLITETGWTSSLGHTRHEYDIETTPAGQAQDLGQLLTLLAANRKRLNLLGFDWYNWANVEQPSAGPFSYSGLFRISSGQFVAKPAYTTFRRESLALEKCRVKGARANVCRRRG